MSAAQGTKRDRARAADVPDDARAASTRGVEGVRRLWSRDRWVRPFVRRYRKALALAVGLGVLAGCFSIGLMFVAGYLLSGTAEKPDWIFSLVVPLAFVQVFGIARPFLSYLGRLASHDWVLRMTSSLRARLFRSLAGDRALGRRLRGVGDALGLAAEDIAHVQDLYVRCVFPIVVGLALWLACSLALGFFSVPFSMLMLLLTGVVAVAAPLVSAIAAGARRLSAKQAREDLYAGAADDVLGLADWVCSGRRDDFLARVRDASARSRGQEARARAFARRRDLAVQAVGGVAVLAATVWAAGRFGSAAGFVGGVGNWATGALGATVWHASPADFVAAFVIAVFPLVDALLPMGDAAAGAPAHIDAVDRLNSLHDPGAEQEGDPVGVSLKALLGIRDPLAGGVSADRSQKRPAAEASAAGEGAAGSAEASATDLEGAAPAGPRVEGNAASDPLADGPGPSGHSGDRASQVPVPDTAPAPDLVFSDVTFSYAADPVIAGLDLVVPHGQAVAVLGPSGAGKSTLLDLACGELEPSSGSVLLGGEPVCDFGERIHDAVGVIRQNPYVFDASLLDNLRVARPDAAEADCRAALARVGLLEAVDAMPGGLATRMGEGGVRLSGGQRHRLALARVLLRDTPVVLLDEPMAALDPATEGLLLYNLLDALAGRTVVMVTHHLLGVERFDRVVFLEDGRIARDGDVLLDGSPAGLARTSARYRRLLAFDRGEA